MNAFLLLVGLLQPAPASAAPASAPAADVVWLREHLAKLVDERAAKYGGPKLTDQDPRLSTLLAMLRFHAENPSVPIPPHVHDAKTLDELFGRSTAVFTINLMVKLAQDRPPKDKLDDAACGRVCDGIVRTAGEDTVQGLSRGGWPMPDESAKAIRAAAVQERASCVDWCAKYPVPGADCVAKANSQADLLVCWQPHPSPPGSGALAPRE